MISRGPGRWGTRTGRLLICPTWQRSCNQRLSLSGKLGEGRLEIGPQVTNLPHIGHLGNRL